MHHLLTLSPPGLGDGEYVPLGGGAVRRIVKIVGTVHVPGMAKRWSGQVLDAPLDGVGDLLKA